jgi:hypothetical protein
MTIVGCPKAPGVKRSCTFRMKRFRSRATSAAAPDASVTQAAIDRNVSYARGPTWWRYPQYTFCGVLGAVHRAQRHAQSSRNRRLRHATLTMIVRWSRFDEIKPGVYVRHRSWRMSSARCWVTCAKSTSARLARAMIVSSSSMYRVRIASKP